LGSAYFEAAGAALRRRVDELVIDVTFCPPDGAFTEPDIHSQNMPGAAYDPFPDRLSWGAGNCIPCADARGLTDCEITMTGQRGDGPWYPGYSLSGVPPSGWESLHTMARSSP
jgi:hypothetical protein